MPVPIRVGLSLNLALKRISLHGYSHIFKVDGDVELPEDYLANLLAKSSPVAGAGCAFVIRRDFFEKVFGVYPINLCDDGYILAKATAFMGKIPPVYDGEKCNLRFSFSSNFSRIFYYGIEHYKWGDYLLVIVLNHLVSVFKRKESPLVVLKRMVFYATGFIYARLKNVRKYEWAESYRKVRKISFLSRITVGLRKKLTSLN